MSEICKLSCVIAVLILFMGTANAQSKSVGCTFCFAGTGITYEYDMGKGSFAELQLRPKLLPCSYMTDHCLDCPPHSHGI